MYVFLIALIIFLFLALKTREKFVINYGNPFNEQQAVSFDKDTAGTRVFSMFPDNTCPCTTPDHDAGLCYEKCSPGYHGVGPVCWADSTNVGGAKMPIGLNPCQPGRRDDGTSCWEDFKCGTYCDSNWSWSDGGYCHTKCGGCGCIRETKFDRQRCGEGQETVGWFCYPKCPKDLPNRVPGMPYLCYNGARGLSYGRGVGTVPPAFKFGNCNA